MITEIVKQVTVKKWEYKGQEYSDLPDCRCEKRLNILKTVHKLLIDFKEDQAYEYLTAKLKEETGE